LTFHATPEALRRLRFRLILALAMGLLLVAQVGHARAAESGLPIPRFVTLRSDKVNVRAGPGVQYPVEWVFERKGMPVEVIAEHENYRKVRDLEGTVGWVHQNLLSSRRGIVVSGAIRALRREPRDGAAMLARVEPDVVGQLLGCGGPWCRVEVGGYRGWLKRTEFWGVYPDEKIE
jgi:SH3-like domain-containing protein